MILNPMIQGPEEQKQWENYLSALYPYFESCNDKDVLEIAPLYGSHTPLIEAHNPKSITLVEQSTHAVRYLIKTYSNHTVIMDDIFFFLETSRNFDVVVCCGLLYHLHSPLYLLELICNRIAPKIIYIETYCTDDIIISTEEDNKEGNRQLKSGWKSVGMTLTFPAEIYVNAMSNMGYKLVTINDTLTKLGRSPKFFIFEKT